MDPMKKFYAKILNAKLQHFPKGHMAAASILGGGLCLILAGLSAGNTESSVATPQTVKIPITNKAPLLISSNSVDSANPTIDNLGAVNVPLNISDMARASQNASPALVIAADIETPVTAPEIQEYVVKNGDSLSVIFKRVGLSDR